MQLLFNQRLSGGYNIWKLNQTLCDAQGWIIILWSSCYYCQVNAWATARVWTIVCVHVVNLRSWHVTRNKKSLHGPFAGSSYSLLNVDIEGCNNTHAPCSMNLGQRLNVTIDFHTGKCWKRQKRGRSRPAADFQQTSEYFTLNWIR